MKKLVVLALCALTALPAVACSSTTDPPPPTTDPSKLSPPEPGKGFQFKTPSFAVPAGVEEQSCYFFKLSELAQAGGMPAGEAINLHRVQIVQRAGSHHMNLFRVKTRAGLDPDKAKVVRSFNGEGECFRSTNWSDWPLIANTQTEGLLDWEFPEGVANVLQQDEWLMLQTHYVNASTQDSPDGYGEVAVNFHTIAKDAVKHEMGTLFATKQSIRVCKDNPSPSFTGTCQFKNDKPVNIIGANGHFHSRGRKFEMFKWDATQVGAPPAAAKFYSSESWDDPPMTRSPELNLEVPANGGVFYSCGYQWTPPSEALGGCERLDKFDRDTYATKPESLSCCYTFGPKVEENEHCNIFVYYWPKQDDINCF